MTDQLDIIVAEVKRKVNELLSSPKMEITRLPADMPMAGIYLFSEGGLPLYVGRTNNLKKRLQYHVRSNHNQATFAFLLARHETGRLKATYRRQGSRPDLLNERRFRVAFDAARKRVRMMEVRFIGETDPIKQALLEIFTALQTRARYNDFDNH
ncbi:MAG TPA: GIY-YIG nuclease family protein [Candidatus Tectomicrobia bacterium]